MHRADFTVCTRRAAALLAAAVLGTGCATADGQRGGTGLERPAGQEKEYPASQPDMMRAAVAAFWELGYIPVAVDPAAGIIRAKRIPERSVGKLLRLGGPVPTRATAVLVRTAPARTRVRLAFTDHRALRNRDGSRGRPAAAVDEPGLYHLAFAEIGRALEAGPAPRTPDVQVVRLATTHPGAVARFTTQMPESARAPAPRTSDVQVVRLAATPPGAVVRITTQMPESARVRAPVQRRAPPISPAPVEPVRQAAVPRAQPLPPVPPVEEGRVLHSSPERLRPPLPAPAPELEPAPRRADPPPPAPTTIPAGPIRVPDVSLADVHVALMKAGFGAGREWGTYGSWTRERVKRFQRDRGLRATGVIDAATWAELSAYR